MCVCACVRVIFEVFCDNLFQIKIQFCSTLYRTFRPRTFRTIYYNKSNTILCLIYCNQHNSLTLLTGGEICWYKIPNVQQYTQFLLIKID